MLLTTGDSQVIKDIATRYCLVSFVTHSSTLLLLYLSDYYLQAGRREHLNVLAVFILFEIAKWLYHKMSIERDTRITYKKKALNFFSLFVKCFDFVHLLKAITVTFLGSFVYYMMAILFGAEIFGKYEQTFMFGLQMSVLTVLPMYINFGLTSLIHMLSGLKTSNSLHQVMYRSTQGTVLGAWGGAFVIPLDWDRPWQAWPVSCSFCALLFCAISYLLMYFHIFLIPNHISVLFRKK